MNNCVREITTDGYVRTLYGPGPMHSKEHGFRDGYGHTALFRRPWGLCLYNEDCEIIVVGGIANLNRHTQVFFYILHSVQFLLLTVELSRNELGNNTQYILSRMHTKYSAEQLLLPFTMLDNNIYIENCTLYLISSLFVTYLLYFKTGV